MGQFAVLTDAKDDRPLRGRKFFEQDIQDAPHQVVEADPQVDLTDNSVEGGEVGPVGVQVVDDRGHIPQRHAGQHMVLALAHLALPPTPGRADGEHEPDVSYRDHVAMGGRLELVEQSLIELHLSPSTRLHTKLSLLDNKAHDAGSRPVWHRPEQQLPLAEVHDTGLADLEPLPFLGPRGDQNLAEHDSYDTSSAFR